MQEHYLHTIDRLLRELSSLEREVATAPDHERTSRERSLKVRRKRFERLIPYQFRQQLRSLCRDVGVEGDFM